MKTNLFNLKRLGLLFQRYFTERFQTELIYWIIMITVFIFIRNVIPAMMVLIFIAGVFYAARFFREIHSSKNGAAYFMIPATQLEKLTVGIVMTSFYYFAMMIITYVIGNLLGTFLNNMLASMNFLHGLLNIYFYNPSYSPLQWELFKTVTVNNSGSISQSFFATFTSFLFSQSIFLLGSLYFKNNQAFKTFFATIIVTISLTFLFLIIGRIFSSDIYVNIDLNNNTIFGIFSPFFWIVSYFRLIKKQV